ncbi:hypothetical protein KX816_04920 [Sphingosinicellaceae bacterium]|nr:hypothetical protein KX816_04920 [Sphingosinicellaceae bacterium]
MLVKWLHHVQLAMPPGGEETARAFYVQLLGIPEVEKPAGLAGRGGCWFEHGALRVHIGVEPVFMPARKAHPAFVVSGLSELAERLEAAGFQTSRDLPVSGHDRLSVADPFGNRVELMEPTGLDERLGSGIDAAAAAAAAAAGMGAPPANATLQPLAFLAGEWRTTGTHPQVPGETLKGRTSFTWCEAGALLLMRSTVDHPLFPDGTAVIGGDGSSRRFAMIYCDERGVSRLFDVTTGPRTAVWRRDDPAFSQEVTISAGTDGETLTSVGRISVEGGPWTGDLSQIFVRELDEE